MAVSILQICVIAVVTMTAVQIPKSSSHQPAPVTDPVAYAIYATLVPQMWARYSKNMLVLKRETDTVLACRLSPSAAADPEWDVVAKNFKQENTRPRLLMAELPIKEPYRLIPLAEIVADNARLALKYPGQWQRRPESMEYAAVSAVGFNAAKTKAIVAARVGGGGIVLSMELREGKWVPAANAIGCGWAT
jgi:hypothetical protein